ncbi:28S rRNA (cytosine-C(5))-methyltransferase-like isoform X2 [Mytilus galloprovincialis]|uniref:28S rRNA (cytosine-C(5))-methyltransferase-like isoform X2 n=1 Tax=Mytilus galloprovincialis TaxID=29158 RepID=UPI003F7B6DE4
MPNKKQLLALVCETLRYGSYLSDIADQVDLLKTEHLLKYDNSLAEALLFDFLIGKKGLVRAGRLKQTMTRHKTDIQKAYQKICEEAGVTSLSEVMDEQDIALPRYVRVNLIKTTVEAVISALESEWEYVVSPATNMKRFRKAIQEFEKHHFTRDLHLPDVLVFPPGTDFHDHELMLKGEIILQDKASCFPAHILNPTEGSVVIDCCAAPGNKTSHVASLMKNKGTIFAFDKDGRRMATLQELTSLAGVTCVTTRCQDFLRVNPDDEKYQDVEYILVDPSCSGSGIVSRMNKFTDDDDSSAADRLESLSNFQALILEQAMKFPNVKTIVYSTCSIHSQENEEVVENVYEKYQEMFDLCNIMPDWPIRGIEGYEHSDHFLRMTPEVSLTNGFFVACFKRKENVKSNRKDDVDINEEKADMISKAKTSKKHKKSKLQEEESNEQDDDDDESLKKKKKKKKHKKKEEECDSDKSCNEPIVSAEAEELSSTQKHKKSKHKKNKHTDEDKIDNDTNIRAEVENDTHLCEDVESVKKVKKHKRKHEEDNKNNTADNDCHLPSKKHKKHKHKNKNDS